MGKFENILICTDLDGTLFNDDKEISDENRKMIEYFKSEGGLFCFVTGRTPKGAALIARAAKPNMPCVVFNGAGIYDFEKKQHIWTTGLDNKAGEVIKLVTDKLPNMGVIVPSDDDVYFCNENFMTDMYYKLTVGENKIVKNYWDIGDEWKKVIFADTPERLAEVKAIVDESSYKDKYFYVKSHDCLFEVLPLGINKSSGIKKLKEYCSLENRMIVAVGDGDNDADMLEFADIGVAMENATSAAKEAADYITVSCNEHAIARVISDLETGKITK